VLNLLLSLQVGLLLLGFGVLLTYDALPGSLARQLWAYLHTHVVVLLPMYLVRVGLPLLGGGALLTYAALNYTLALHSGLTLPVSSCCAQFAGGPAAAGWWSAADILCAQLHTCTASLGLLYLHSHVVFVLKMGLPLLGGGALLTYAALHISGSTARCNS
jgi:hypothetical protein